MTIISYPAANHLVSICAACTIVHKCNLCVCMSVTRARVSMQYACTHVRVPVSSIALATSLHYISSYSYETSYAKQVAAEYNIFLAKIYTITYIQLIQLLFKWTLHSVKHLSKHGTSKVMQLKRFMHECII